MKINSFNQQQFSGIVARETNKSPENIQKDTFNFYKEKDYTPDTMMNFFRISGGMNVAADAVVDSCVQTGVNVDSDENSKMIVEMAMMNSVTIAVITQEIFAPLYPNVISSNVLFSGARKVNENVISVDLNTAASDEDLLAKKNYMEDEPSYRLYLGTDSESDTGFIYANKLK